MLSTPEKILNIALALAVLAAYAVLALRKIGSQAAVPTSVLEPREAAPLSHAAVPPRAARLWLGLRALLSRTEPAILLDSARFIVLLGWIRFMPNVDAVAETLAHSPELAVPKGIFTVIDLASVPVALLYASVWIYRAGLVLAALGIFARAGAALAALANVFAWSVAFSFDHTSHFHVVPLVLMTLALAPARGPSLLQYGRALALRQPLTSAGTHPAWLRFAVMFAVATAYFQAGVEKLIRSGPHWLNGTTLAGHLLRVGTELGHRAAEAPHAVLVLASIAVLAWELSFFLVLFYPRLRAIAALSAIGFHLGLYATMDLGFPHLVLGLLFLVPPYAWLRPRAMQEVNAAATPSTQRARVAIGFALLLAQWVPTFVRGGVYPFLGYDMFNGYYLGGEVLVRRAHLLARSGDNAGWVELDPSRALALSSAHFTEQMFYRYVSKHPSHAKYAASRAAYCEELLANVKRRAEPTAIALRLEADTVLAGSPKDQKRIELVTCGGAPAT